MEEQQSICCYVDLHHTSMGIGGCSMTPALEPSLFN